MARRGREIMRRAYYWLFWSFPFLPLSLRSRINSHNLC